MERDPNGRRVGLPIKEEQHVLLRRGMVGCRWGLQYKASTYNASGVNSNGILLWIILCKLLTIRVIFLEGFDADDIMTNFTTRWLELKP